MTKKNIIIISLVALAIILSVTLTILLIYFHTASAIVTDKQASITEEGDIYLISLEYKSDKGYALVSQETYNKVNIGDKVPVTITEETTEFGPIITFKIKEDKL